MNVQKYDPIIEFVDHRIEAIKKAPINGIVDRSALSELEGVKTVCQALNLQEALVHRALFPREAA